MTPIHLMRSTRRAVTVLGAATTLLHPRAAHGQTERTPAERRADSLMAARDFAGAYRAYEALALESPTQPDYWYAQGMAAAQLGRYADGARAFGRAADISRGPSASYNAGAMHARLGHADSAFAWLARAVRTGFGDEKLLHTDEDLASLRGTARFDSLVYSATHAPTPCAAAAERRRFDFWVGEWDVTAPGGQPAGKSIVQVISGGCALLENWTDRRGAMGKSLSTYNPALGQWQQYWIGQDGNPVEYRESTWRGTAISLSAHFAAVGTTPAVDLRLTFTPLDENTVRQLGERSTDGGKSWGVTYDFRYRRTSHPLTGMAPQP
jgi:tetratricopeptide (TPR) repeat protein